MLVNPIGLEDWQAEGMPYASIDQLYKGELNTHYEGIKNYQLCFYCNGVWKPEYDRWVDMLNGMYAGPGKEIVAWNQAQTSEMLFSQPVVHEFPNIRAPTLLLIGGKDRTAPGANRAPEAVAKRLGDYPTLGRRGDSRRDPGGVAGAGPLATGGGARTLPRGVARGAEKAPVRPAFRLLEQAACLAE